jgi:TPR repeat protein
MYFLGEGIEQNYSKAMEWYLLAAAQGSKEAQNSVGYMYFEGKGVEKDLIEAYAWFQLAASSDYDQAKLNSSVVEANLSNEEIQQAKERAERYLSEYPSAGK